MNESTTSAGSLLLDTNASIAQSKNEPHVHRIISVASEIFVPYVVLGEMYYGAMRSTRVEQNLANVAAFAARSAVLYPDEVTTRKYGEIKLHLRKMGRPIPENDIWIAALALRHGLAVFTQDAHFNEVDGLTVIGW